MQHDQCLQRIEEIESEIAVAGDIHAIARDGGKSQIIARWRWRSKGNPLPASAPEPSGSTLIARAGLLQALEIARQHFEIGEK